MYIPQVRVWLMTDQLYIYSVYVIISCLFCCCFLQRTNCNSNLNHGSLHLSGIQLRGHAMFSNEDQPDDDTDSKEYAWLLEIQLGTFFGNVTISQVLYSISLIDRVLL